jgi:hypothetical protein
MSMIPNLLIFIRFCYVWWLFLLVLLLMHPFRGWRGVGGQIWAALDWVVYVKPNLGGRIYGGICEAKYGPPWMRRSM